MVQWTKGLLCKHDGSSAYNPVLEDRDRVRGVCWAFLPSATHRTKQVHEGLAQRDPREVLPHHTGLSQCLYQSISLDAHRQPGFNKGLVAKSSQTCW